MLLHLQNYTAIKDYTIQAYLMYRTNLKALVLTF